MEYAIIILIFAAAIAAIWFISYKGGFRHGSGNIERQMKAAEHGDVFAQYELAKKYHEGIGVDKDIRKAFNLYLKAAEHGHVEAQFITATFFDKGCAGIEPNNDEAYKWYLKAASQGHARAQFEVSSDRWGSTISKMQIDGDSISFSSSGSEHVPSKAPYPREKLERLMNQAEDGDVDAQYDLGIRYYSGDGVEKDHAKAVKWFTMAAEQDDAQAQFNLGIMYGRGEGAGKDINTSMQWLRKAAEQGHAEAVSMLSKMSGRK
ncbi:MAG TPA: tetratricopeptide repeat protein [Desulfomonilia bacterium]